MLKYHMFSSTFLNLRETKMFKTFDYTDLICTIMFSLVFQFLFVKYHLINMIFYFVSLLVDLMLQSCVLCHVLLAPNYGFYKLKLLDQEDKKLILC